MPARKRRLSNSQEEKLAQLKENNGALASENASLRSSNRRLEAELLALVRENQRLEERARHYGAQVYELSASIVTAAVQAAQIADSLRADSPGYCQLPGKPNTCHMVAAATQLSPLLECPTEPIGHTNKTQDAQQSRRRRQQRQEQPISTEAELCITGKANERQHRVKGLRERAPNINQ